MLVFEQDETQETQTNGAGAGATIALAGVTEPEAEPKDQTQKSEKKTKKTKKNGKKAGGEGGGGGKGKSSSDAYGAKSRSNVLLFDPDDVVIVGLDESGGGTVAGPEHPLYDERVKMPVDEALVLNIMHLGVIEPVVVTRDTETGDTVVVAGRQRTRATREANKRLRAMGCEPQMLPAVVRRGDEALLTGIMASENEVRQSDSPMVRARKMQKRVDLGKSEKEIAVVFGCSVATVKNTLKLLECCKEVQRAVDREQTPVTAAYELAKLEPEAQREAVAKMIVATSASGATSKRGKARAAKAALAGKEKTAPSKKLVLDHYEAILATCEEGEYRDAVLPLLQWVLGKRAVCPRFPKDKG